jgi:hypothetical protein
MFDLINGIPVHPLVVHAIVVLLPLATLGTSATFLVVIVGAVAGFTVTDRRTSERSPGRV